MELNIQTAELALREASESNPGAWADDELAVLRHCGRRAVAGALTVEFPTECG